MTLVHRAKTWSDPDSAAHATTDQTQDSQKLIELEKDVLKTLKEKKAPDSEVSLANNRPLYKTRRVLFVLGLFLGSVLGLTAVQPYNLQQMQDQLSLFVSEVGLKYQDLDFSFFDEEWTRIRSSIPEFWKFNNDGREFLVGQSFKDRGLSADFPVVLIPGVISTGLESWTTSPEYRPFFRQKVWGSLGMLQQVTFNKERWINMMMLDAVTGLDPPDIKVRAAEGIEAASSFIQGYWIWSKIVENLAVVNYDTNNLHLAPYDWRLSYHNLEERDGYFSRLKSTIEGFKRRQGKKTVITAHSMGSTVMLYFFKWVESPAHGGGGPNWVEDHIEAFISIAGTHLGVAKAMSAFLSGEMRDTVQMNPAASHVLERFFSRKDRQKLFRSWAGSASMWIKGGSAIWGNSTHAPDDQEDHHETHGELISFRATQETTNVSSEAIISSDTERQPMTADEASLWILEHTPSTFQRMVATNYSFGIERDEGKLKENDLDHTKWTNPLETRLPNAPSMKIYCVYGHGKPTERSYWYTRGPNDYDDDFADAVDPLCADPSEDCYTPRPPLDLPLSRTSWIDYEYTNETIRPPITNGVRMGEGDGTVSLVSLGAMCVEGWKRPRWNPASIEVKTVELPHLPIPSLVRGGANTSDHVDVLGSTRLNEIILQVATGVGDEIEENFVSNIREYAKRMRWDNL